MAKRLVLFSDARQLDGRGAGDVLVPLNDVAADDLGAQAAEFSTSQAEGLALAFETGQAILAALDNDSAWRKILCYNDYDLRPMALKNVFFALEDVARVVLLAQRAAAAHPHIPAVLLDGDPVIRHAVKAVLPGVIVSGRNGFKANWINPLARFVRDRWHNGRAKRGPVSKSPVVCFLDVPHRAQIMGRTLAHLAADHPVHNAQLNRWEWPADLPVKPDATYDWNGYSSPGAWRRIARHVIQTRARTDLEAFEIPGKAWIPPRLLWRLRYDDVQRYANMLEALEGLARALRPALWITLEDLFAFGKCVAAVGERFNIPTLNVQHGIIGAYPYRTGVDVVGTFAAFGEESRQTLIERGADPGRIVVTGPVRYDDILALKPDRSRLFQPVGLDPARPVVLFASQPTRRLITVAVKRTALRALLCAAQEIGVQVVIKAHPLEDDPVLDEVLAAQDQVVPVVRDQLYEWLLVCDVMATISSTVVYEAAMAERPALALEWSGNSDVAEYLANGIALLPESPDRVGETLRRLLSHEPTRASLLAAQRGFVAQHLAGNDGKASERLAALARTLMGVMERG
jgi:glycosyltransferase involved in cell wall biosynthesis